MSDIKNWSASAGGNTSAAPDGFPEGMPPSGVNDAAREQMAATRRWYDDAEWKDLGDTPSYSTASIFTISGDYASTYHAGRRIKAFDGGTTFYGYIASSTYTANTKVSVTLDSGNLTSSLSSVAVGILSFDNHSMPRGTFAELSASANFTSPVTFGAATTHSATASFTSRAAFNAGIDVSGTANLTESVIIGKTLAVSGTASFGSRVAFNEGIDVSATANFTGAVKFGDTVSFSASPAISDFTNSTHDHADAAGGGALVSTSKVVQIVHVQDGAVATGTTQIPHDDNIPQNTEGDEYMTLAITPDDASNILYIEAEGYFASNFTGKMTMTLFKDSGADAISVGRGNGNDVNEIMPVNLKKRIVAGTISAITFKIRAGINGAGTTTFNGEGGVRKYAGLLASCITITEVTP
jgi:hypothetical protein